MNACMRVAKAGALLVLLASPHPADAQVVSPLSPALDSVRIASVLHGAPMRTGSWKYGQWLIHPAGDSIALGTRAVAVNAAVLAGSPVWQIAEERRGTMLETADTVTLLQSDLSPQHWAARIGTAQVGAAFTHDSVFGAIETYRGRSSFTAAIPPGIILSAAMLECLVEVLPLDRGYHITASVLTVADAPRVMTADITVEDEESVRVGAGVIAAWRVNVRTEDTLALLWISRAEHRVVRKDETIRGDHLVSAVLP